MGALGLGAGPLQLLHFFPLHLQSLGEGAGPLQLLHFFPLHLQSLGEGLFWEGAGPELPPPQLPPPPMHEA